MNRSKVIIVAAIVMAAASITGLLPRFKMKVAAAPHFQQAASEPAIARVKINGNFDVARLSAMGLDLLEMREGDDLFILTTPDEIKKLSGEGWTISFDRQQTELLRAHDRDTFRGGYRTVVETRAALENAQSAHPDLAEFFTYGRSWQHLTSNGSQGHEMFGIRLTNRLRPGPKPTFFFMAAIHSRELATTELTLRFIDHLLNGYGVDGDATWLLDEHQIVVVPTVNPDGRVMAEQGYLQRKNMNSSYGGGCPNPPTPTSQYGVDLNRNTDFKWGIIDTPGTPRCGQTYPGPAAASEPETAALQSLVLSLFADQRGPLDTDAAPMTTTGMFLTLHSYSDLVLWPWGWTNSPAPNGNELSLIGRKFASYNGYTAQQSIDLYATSGTTDDWAYGVLGIPAMTFEVGPASGSCGGFFPPFTCLDGGTGGAFWTRNLPAFLYAARIARAPYDVVQGPTPEFLSATLIDGNQVELRAQLDEQRNGGQPIVAAEYYVDTPPWRGGTPIEMDPLDGAFNTQIETATSIIGPFEGRRLIYVRGRDSTGKWGPVRAVFTPGAACANIIAPTSKAFSTAGGSGRLSLIGAVACNWIATTSDDWITIVSAPSGSGNATISFEVRENFTGRFRTGALAVAGRTFTVNQDGGESENCIYGITPAYESFPFTGGDGGFNVITSEECIWTATSNVNWITFTSSDNGIGGGAVTFLVDRNKSGVARKGTITVGGKTFSVKQKAF